MIIQIVELSKRLIVSAKALMGKDTNQPSVHPGLVEMYCPKGRGVQDRGCCKKVCSVRLTREDVKMSPMYYYE